MILHRVWAENVLKYATLELTDLPPHGLIGVSGQNEAGKSSIGEIICFALFGRTFAYEASDIVHVIRWGEPRCAASVDFSLHDQHYTIARFLDEHGNHGVRLSAQHAEPLARGVEPVREALEQLLGFGFEEFIESFYLAQREITTPHPHSTAVKKIAGIGALEQVTATAQADIAQEHGFIDQAERSTADITRLITELDLDPSLLPALERQRHDLDAQQERRRHHKTELHASATGYQEAESAIPEAVQTLSVVESPTTYHAWRTHVEDFVTRLDALTERYASDTTLTRLLAPLQEFGQAAQHRLAAVETLRHRAGQHRQHLAYLLGATATKQADTPSTAEPFEVIRERQQHQMHTAIRRRTRLQVGVYGCLLLAVLAWAAWGLLTLAPESNVALQVSPWVTDTLGAELPRVTPWLLGAAASLSALWGLCGYASRKHRAHMTQLQYATAQLDKDVMEARHQAQALDTFDETALPQAVTLLTTLQDKALAAEARRSQRGVLADWLDATHLDACRTQLHTLQQDFVASLLDQQQALAAQLHTLEDAIALGQEQMHRLDEQIAREQACHQALQELHTAMARQQETLTACQHRIQVRELACDLLERGAQYMATTFNRDIRSLVSRTLPLLTQGRYGHLKIDESLDVQVFSNAKHDFMQLEEISSGTQRQIMLAVRLALSLQFIHTTLGRRQFIFLDEPFAFFDQERTLSALQALPTLSEHLSQVWIVAQTFPEDSVFDLHIRCQQDQVRLCVPQA